MSGGNAPFYLKREEVVGSIVEPCCLVDIERLQSYFKLRFQKLSRNDLSIMVIDIFALVV